MEDDSPVYVSGYLERPTKWPVIWGIVAIVFGVFGALAQGMKAIQTGAMMFFPTSEFEMDGSMKTGDPAQDRMLEEMMKEQAELMQSIQDAAPIVVTVAIALVCIALLLIIGGILLCMRKRIASPLLQTWAVLKIIVGGLGVWIGYEMTGAVMGNYGQMMNSVMSSTGAGASASPMPDLGKIMGIFAQVMLFVSFAWLVALPVFYLIWFNREMVKEDMKNGIGW